MKNYKLYIPGIAYIFGPLLSYISLPFITHAITPDSYSSYVYYLSVLSIISFISLLPSINSTISRFSNKDRDDYKKNINTIRFILFLSMILYFLSVFIFNYFFNTYDEFYFIIIAVSILAVNFLNFIKSYLLINNEKTIYSIFLFLIILFQYGYLFYSINSGYFNISDILFGNLILIVSVIIYKFKSIISIKKWKFLDFHFDKKILKFILFSFAISFSTIIYNNTDKIMIDYLVDSADALAFYQVSFQLFGFPIETLYAFFTIFTPAFLYRAYDIDKKLYIKNLKITFKLLFFVLYVIANLLFMHESELKKLLLNERFIVNDLLPLIFIINQSIFLIYLIATNIFIVHEKRLYIIYCLLVSSFINVLFNWFLITSYGYIGAAYSTLFSYILLTCLVMFFSFKLFDFIFIDKIDALLIVSSPLLFYFFSENYLLWLLSILVFSFIYFITNVKSTYINFLKGV